MQVFEINTVDDYKKVLERSLYDFNTDWTEENTLGFFDGIHELEEFLQFNFNELYDKYDEPKFDDFTDIPDVIWEREILRRMGELNLNFPFIIVVSGRDSWDRSGSYKFRTFYETTVQKV